MSNVPNKSPGPKNAQMEEFHEIDKRAVQYKLKGETSYKKSSSLPH